jgi:hypothetical protein
VSAASDVRWVADLARGEGLEALADRLEALAERLEENENV